MLQPIGERKLLSSHIEEELTRAIKNGTYAPGYKIPTENELCSIFNVSRTAVREAIKKLSAKGIVDVRMGSGVYVSEISIQNAGEVLNLFFGLSSDPDLILNTIHTRRLIEPAIAAEAAKHRDESHIDLLKKNMSKMINCPVEDKKKEAELDNEFHSTLLSVTGNPVLQLLIDPIFNLIPTFKTEVFAKKIQGDLIAEKEIMLNYHKGILNSIIRQDVDKVRRLMNEHLEQTQINYLKSIDSA